LITCVTAAGAAAQDLTPRSYALAPPATNAVIVTYALAKGDILFDPTVPVTDASATVHTPVLSYYRTFDVFGRFASATASVPWASGDFSATVAGTDRQARRQGFADSSFRLAVNLLGGPAVPRQVFAQRPPPRTIVGVSLRVVAPTGRYVDTRAINPGNNRWAFKPEIGVSRRIKRVLLDGYGGAWWFTDNDDYLAPNVDTRGSVRSQAPIASFEGHVSYDIKPRLWVSGDVNYWYGGRTTVNGVRSLTSLQANSRFGVSGSVPISRAQALKVSFSDGVITRVGGSFTILSAAWQYSWLGVPLRRNR
jgi:hypothetical protein